MSVGSLGDRSTIVTLRARRNGEDFSVWSVLYRTHITSVSYYFYVFFSIFFANRAWMQRASSAEKHLSVAFTFVMDMLPISMRHRSLRRSFVRLAVSFSFLFGCTSLVAQPDEDATRPRIGGFAGINLNNHIASFSQLPDIPNCCPSFESGNGIGFHLGGEFLLFVDELTDLQLKLGFIDLRGDLKKEEPIGPVLTPRGPEPGWSEHVISSKISLFFLEPSTGYRLLGDKLRLSLGPRIGFLLSKSFEQKETLVRPEDVSFTTGKVRNQFSGDIPKASSIYAGITAGISYDISIGKNLFLTPEASYSLPITSVSSAVTWKQSALQFTANILYRIPKPPPPPEPPPPPPPPPPPAIAVSLAVEGVSADGKKSDDVRITVEEFINNELFPFLPFIFFQQESNDLTLTRQRLLTPIETSRFNEKEVQTGALNVYGQMLNIVGARMRQYPNARITLTGCNNGMESEKNNLALSQKRAEAVRSYFVNVWGIKPNRIAIKSRNLPEQTPSIDQSDGQEEARRVEITSDTYEITAPILRESIDKTISIPKVNFIPEVTAQAGLAEWTLDVRQQLKPLKHFEGNSAIAPSLEWNLSIDEISGADAPVDAKLAITDNVGQKRDASVSFPVQLLTVTKKRQELRGDTRIDRFSLILFDFGKATIEATNQKIVDLIKAVITPTSSVTIRGYTDRIGDPEYNRALAQRRCDATRGALGASLKGLPVTLEAIGNNVLLFDNQLPEGRNFCRTVQVIVETNIPPEQRK